MLQKGKRMEAYSHSQGLNYFTVLTKTTIIHFIVKIYYNYNIFTLGIVNPLNLYQREVDL